MPDWSKCRGQTKNSPGPPCWGLGGRLITCSRKKKHITEFETRITTGPYGEAGAQDVNTLLEQRAKQRMTHKPPMKLCEDRAMDC